MIDGLPRLEVCSFGVVSYPEALVVQQDLVFARQAGTVRDQLLLLEHPAVSTVGTSGRRYPEHLLVSRADLRRLGITVHNVSRGGDVTYHGPGQRIIYLMLDLNRRGYNIRRFINQLESWIIKSLKTIDIESHTNQDKLGIWVPKKRGDKLSEEKIASIGLRVRKGITFHGISLNVNPNLENYKGIKPCGLSSEETTSIEDIGIKISQKELDEALINNFEKVFEAELLLTQTLS